VFTATFMIKKLECVCARVRACVCVCVCMSSSKANCAYLKLNHKSRDMQRVKSSYWLLEHSTAQPGTEMLKPQRETPLHSYTQGCIPPSWLVCFSVHVPAHMCVCQWLIYFCILVHPLICCNNLRIFSFTLRHSYELRTQPSTLLLPSDPLQ
jgi:hypothetical protein